ncbi:MAG: B12-binding domain-containing radical SAM protein [Ignavibacteria bacterium]|nr:B12-binding domain-containing radical SAM protein [Ignavibacteria bacterium]MBT8381679.1 B12-binding domain-containing radical SAM protein [Ignavibacteria bacterium]MBT8392973.1 B12-binding domain-containing radical SAM protein [Ignavibacteria bacterium]NNL20442.1 B12-binding domain-containing radical SAM protein [Ignavibacteriaceae bacterium]
MKVLLTHGYFLKEDPAELRIMKPYPPLGILYISAYLNEKGVKNKIFDTTFSSKGELKKCLIEEKPDLVAIYVNLMTKLNVLETIKFIKSKNELIKSKIILGGPEVRYNAEDFLKNGADYVVIGEGEKTFYELILALEQKKELKNVKSIGYIDQNGKATFTPERSLIKNIDELPFPNRGGIQIKDYQNAWKTKYNRDAISVCTMRGCPYTCKWCSRAVYGLTYRRRSPNKVVEELRLITDEYNPDSLWFVDDVFTVSHKWLFKFNDELKKNNLKITYECITRADRMNEEVIAALKESGCFRVWIGAESGSQRIIDVMDRRVKVEQVQKMIQLSNKYGIETGTFIMLGYPGETEKDIEETIHHLVKCSPDHFTITVGYPIKGTEFFQEIEANQTEDFDWEKFSDRERDFKRTYPRRYYNFAVRRVVNEVKYHQKLNGSLFKIDALKFKSKSIAAKAGMWWSKNING